MAAAYDGPVIDAHHHFWRFGLNRHPWLQQIAEDSPDAMLRGDFLPADYAARAARQNIVASVHVEGNWDPGDPLGETDWLDGLERPDGIACRYVAYATLGDPASADIIERHAAHPRTVGLREIVSWHPDAAKRRTPANDRFDNRVWRGNLRRAGDLGLSFDLLVTSHQFADAARLAADFEDISFVVNHYGCPMDRDAEGMQFWRRGLKALASQPNVTIKLSDPVAYNHAWTWDSLRD
jgi:predicted TIM-barrel fold metal-dependent hydrolase